MATVSGNNKITSAHQLQNTYSLNYSSEWRKGMLGSILFHIAVISLLLVLGLNAPDPPFPPDNGILVNFGTDETGEGLIEPSGSSTEVTGLPEESVPILPSVASERILTQDVEKNATSVKTQQQIEANRKVQEQLEADRILKQQEDAEKQRIIDEQRRLNEIMALTKNALVGAQNSGTSSTGEGITGGPGNQGVITGSINSSVRGTGSGTGTSGVGSGEPSYTLEGRGSVSIPKPKYDYQEAGIVVVEVTVDRSGKVIAATPGAKGSTTLDEYFLKVSKDAAMEAKFEAKPNAPEIQKGTITYNFILN